LTGVVAKFPVWLETLPAGVEFAATDFSPFRAGLAGTKFQDAAPVVTVPRALAAAIARIAAARWQRGEASDPAALDANYVRRSDAELFWKE
jgi:tRNA threonylcarbamoyladenosine biosynthesis protein TsaB